jgi:hypothetical protein
VFRIRIAHKREFPRHHTTIEGIRTADAIKQWVKRLGGTDNDADDLTKKGRTEFGGEVVWVA